MFEKATQDASKFFKAIQDKVSLKNALDGIKSFGRDVINVFKDIYDKVIGNSWWTDTVNEVVDSSDKLWDKASAGLNKFKTNTINVFKNIFNKNKNLNLFF